MDAYIENRPFDEIQVGDSASLERTLTRQDIDLFGVLSGDVNPAHFDEEYAQDTMFKGTIGHGMWGAGLLSAILGTQLPGPGAIYLNQSLRFRRPVYAGDTITATVTVTEKNDEKKRLVLDCKLTNQTGEVVTLGTAEVLAATEKIRRPRVTLPAVRFEA